MWAKEEPKLTCNNFSFRVSHGSIIKYAISQLHDVFIFDVTYIWNVPLNKIDAYDNKTVLDFAKGEIERNKGTAIEKSLESYYSQIRAAGAKHT